MQKRILDFKCKGRTRSGIGPSTETVPHSKQIRTINELLLASPQTELQKRLIAELKRKHNGYKAQDSRRQLYDAERFISIESMIEHLVISRLKCAYCKENTEVFYKQVRSPTQWSLDRIDNTIGHTRENTVVSCLQCNLRRRTTDYEKFLFTKELKLTKAI